MSQLNVRQDMEEGGTWEGKRSGGVGEEEKEEEEKWEKFQPTWKAYVTGLLTKYCMVAYEW